MKKKNLINYLILFIPLSYFILISLISLYKLGLDIPIYKNYFLKQLLWFFLGFLTMFWIINFKAKRLFKYSKYFYFLNVFLLILVLFIGNTAGGSKAWFKFGFISFQPSELMKFTLALYLSESLVNFSNKKELKYILEAIFITLIPSLFVFLEPDTGAIFIYFIMLLGVFLALKISKKWYLILFIFLSLFLSSFSFLYFFEKDILIKLIGTSFFYRVDRILTFIKKSSFQLDRALIAIGTASLFGSNNNIYIPEAATDFIIAALIHNLGIVSFIFVLIAFFSLDIYFLFQIFKLKKKKAKIFYASFLAMFIFAQIHNIGMNLGILPIIGLPLPFISYGGTNILVYFSFLGVLISLRKEN